MPNRRYDAAEQRAGGVSTANSESELRGRITVREIAKRLGLGRIAVYTMLEQGVIPGIRVGRRWIITRYAYAGWEHTCGMRFGAGLSPQHEVTLN